MCLSFGVLLEELGSLMVLWPSLCSCASFGLASGASTEVSREFAFECLCLEVDLAVWQLLKSSLSSVFSSSSRLMCDLSE